MKILFLIKDAGVEKTTIFIELVKALIERGAKIHIIISRQSNQYVTERYYDEEPNIRVDVLDVENSKSPVGSLKNFIRKNEKIEKIIWVIFNFVMQCLFWIRYRAHSKNELYIFEEFLTLTMRNFKPQEKYDYIWTIDEYGLLWAEWINRNSEIKYTLIHHSFELYWEHFSLQKHKHWQYFKQYALFEKARKILQKAEIIIIQDEARWKVLCTYTGIDCERKKYLWPLSMKDYPMNKQGNGFEKLKIPENKKVIFYPTLITPRRGCIELVKVSQQLDDQFVTVLHGFTAVESYLAKIIEAALSPDKIIISNTTLDYQQLVDVHRDVWCVFLYYGETDNNDKYIVNSSNKLVMALQAGKPIITIGNQTLANLCSEYECGIAINKWDTVKFADAVYRLEQNYVLYCENARRCYEERFNIKPYADKIYNQLMAETKKGDFYDRENRI